MRRFLWLGVILAILPACTQTYYYERSSGLRPDAKPSLMPAFLQAKTECQGEVAQARLGGSGRAPIDEAILAERAMFGCMSKRGYDVRP